MSLSTKYLKIAFLQILSHIQGANEFMQSDLLHLSMINLPKQHTTCIYVRLLSMIRKLIPCSDSLESMNDSLLLFQEYVLPYTDGQLGGETLIVMALSIFSDIYQLFLTPEPWTAYWLWSGGLRDVVILWMPCSLSSSAACDDFDDFSGNPGYENNVW